MNKVEIKIKIKIILMEFMKMTTIIYNKNQINIKERAIKI